MVSTLVSLCFGSSRLGHTVKTNCIKLNTVESRDMLDFWFFKKEFGTRLSTTFCGWLYKKKICYILYWSNYWSNFIVWLLLLLEISGNICLVFVYYPVCDVVNFEINLSFFVKLFSYITKKTKQKSQEAFSIILKGLSVAKCCPRPESATLTHFSPT